MVQVLPIVSRGDNLITLLANDDLDVEIVTTRTIEEHAPLLKQIVSVFPKRIANSKWIATLKKYRRMRGWAPNERWAKDEGHKIGLCTGWIRANARRTPHGGHSKTVIEIKKVYLKALATCNGEEYNEDEDDDDAESGSGEDGEVGTGEDGEAGESGSGEDGEDDELEDGEDDDLEDGEFGEGGDSEVGPGDEENEEDEEEADADECSVRSTASLHSEPAAAAVAATGTYVALSRTLQKRDSHVSICSSDPGPSGASDEFKAGEMYDPAQHRAIIKSKRKGLSTKPAAARAVKQCKQKVKGPGAIEEVSAEREPTGPVVRAEIERLLPLVGNPQPLYAAGPQVVSKELREYGKKIFQIRNKTQGEVIQVTFGAFRDRFILAGHVLEGLMHEGYSTEQLSVVKIAMLEQRLNPTATMHA